LSIFQLPTLTPVRFNAFIMIIPYIMVAYRI